MPSLIASTQVAGVSTSTTPAIDTTGANLIVVNLSGVGTATLSDSKGNTWTFIVQGGTGNFSKLYYCLAPTVGAGHTFTFTGTSVFVSLQVQAWSGMTAFHNSSSAGGGAAASGGSPGALVPLGGLELFVAGYQKDGGAADVYSVDQLFTITNQTPFTSAVNAGGALAYKISPRSENPFWSDNHGTSGRNGMTMATFTMPAPTVPVVPPFVQAAFGAAGAGPGTVITMPNDVTSGNWLIICAGNIGGSNCGGGSTAVYTDTRGLTYTVRHGAINVGGGQSTCCILTAPITSSGPEAITRTIVSSNYPVNTWAVELGGFTGTPTIGATNTGTSDSVTTVNTGNVTTAAADNILIAAASDSNVNPFTAVSSGDISGLGLGVSQGMFSMSRVGPGTYSVTFTKAAGGSRMAAAALIISFTPSAQQYGLPGTVATAGAGQKAFAV